MNRADLKQRAKAQLGGSIFGSVWLYAVLVFFWRLIPQWIWERLKVRTKA